MTTAPEAVVVLIGAPASGKTTMRRRLLDQGRAARTLSLDEERAALRDRDVAAGREPRPLQDYSLAAVRRCEVAARELLESGRGYIADATHLRRKERMAHVRAARAAGLPVVAVLLPDLPVPVLAARNAARSALRRVPDEALARHAYRRSLLNRSLLEAEGFDEVVEVLPEQREGVSGR